MDESKGKEKNVRETKEKEETNSEELVVEWTEHSTEEESLSKEDLMMEIKKLEEELEAKKKDYDALYDNYLRALADFDNYRKRMSREKADIMSYGNEELVKELIPILDNLERALDHSQGVDNTGSLIEGVELVYKQLLVSLEKFGVQVIDAEGEKFDPKYHEAVETIETDEVEPGVVLSQMLKGYTIKDRLLRPALVSVSKGKEEVAAEPKEFKELVTQPMAESWKKEEPQDSVVLLEEVEEEEEEVVEE